MKQTEKRVKISLHTMIEDNGNKEHNQVTVTGMFYQADSIHVLTFDEQHEDNNTIKNLMTIHADKVNVKRTGAVTMNQQFRLDQTTEGQFHHPFGKMGMETTTHRLIYEPLQRRKQGQLYISYHVKLDGETERAHQLKLIFIEEETD